MIIGIVNDKIEIFDNGSIDGYDGWIMVNLYPQIASHPKALHKKPNKTIMAKSDQVLRLILKRYNIDAVWAAWGNAIDYRPYLGDALVNALKIIDCDYRWFYRGEVTKKGHPRHPLYMKEREEYKRFLVFDYAETYL